MKSINLITIAFVLILFSCQNKPTEQASADSTKTDTSALAPNAADSVVEPSQREILDAQLGEEDKDASNNEDFDYNYEGLINDKIKVRVNIFQFRGEKKARMIYLNAKKIINMDFRYPEVGHFNLTEKIDGKPTGIWKLSSEEEDILSGTWSSPDGAKQMPISLSFTEGMDFDDILPKEEIKTGKYKLQELNTDEETKKEFPVVYSEDLFVKNMAGNTIYFDLYIQGPPPGVHMGFLNGFANKSGDAYIYKNNEGCQITMKFSTNKVELSQKGADIDCGFGANIGAFGTLTKEN